jgi:hypothetical protein
MEGNVKDIKEYKEEQKALVLYRQSDTSFVEKKTEKMGIAITSIYGKACIPFTKNNKSIEKLRNLTIKCFRCIIYILTKQEE